MPLEIGQRRKRGEMLGFSISSGIERETELLGFYRNLGGKKKFSSLEHTRTAELRVFSSECESRATLITRSLSHKHQ